MAKLLTLQEVLRKAISKEIEAQRLYTELSPMMQEQPAQDAFRELAQQERGHQHLLESYLRGELKKGALSPGQIVDYKLAERLDQPEISTHMEMKEVFMLAADREKLAHEFYLELAGVHPEGEVKGLLTELATQELEHKRRMETLYTEVAFPQTDGG